MSEAAGRKRKRESGGGKEKRSVQRALKRMVLHVHVYA
jgi:hypothetical protein